MNDAKQTGHAWAALVLLLVGGVLLTALITPALFNAILSCARAWKPLEGAREWEFGSIAARCLMFSFAVLTVPALRLSGIANVGSLGWRWRPHGGRRLATGFALGAGLIILILLVGILLHAYELTGAFKSIAGIAVKMFGIAMLVSIIEEFFFRAVVFGIARRAVSVVPATLLAAFFFAIIHFAKPVLPVGVVYGHWYSGFEVLPFLLTAGDFCSDSIVMFCVLFLLGVVLCFAYDRTRNLYFPIGLHAGLVWAMGVGRSVLGRNYDQWPVLFGESMTITKTAVGLIVAIVLLVGSVIYNMRTVATEEYHGCG